MSSQIESNKKSNKRLTLNRETVSNLTAIKESMLTKVVGGMRANSSAHINNWSKGTCCC